MGVDELGKMIGLAIGAAIVLWVIFGVLIPTVINAVA